MPWAIKHWTSFLHLKVPSMKCTDPSSKWRTHCSTKRICKNADYGETWKYETEKVPEYRRIWNIQSMDGKANLAHLKITTCSPINGVPTCLKFSSRKGFTCDSQSIYGWKWIILSNCPFIKMLFAIRSEVIWQARSTNFKMQHLQKKKNWAPQGQ